MRGCLISIAVVVAALVGAFFYFSEADIPRATLEAQYATPPSQFVTLPDGARVHYRERGPKDASVLVLVHGSDASLFTWEPWSKNLSDKFRVISLDLPAHGLTGPGDHVPVGFMIARMSFMRPVMLHITPRALFSEGLNDAIVRKSVITDKMIDMYWRFHLMEGAREANAERFATNEDYGYVKDHIGQIKAPTLILWGAQDHLIPVAAAHAFNRAIPGSKVIIYPATGHIPMEEVADQSAADVRAFLSTP